MIVTDNVCKCCRGTGVKRNQQTGMNQECLCCCGSGESKIARENRLKGKE